MDDAPDPSRAPPVPQAPEPELEPAPVLAGETNPPALRPWSAFEFVDYRLLWLGSLASIVGVQLRLLVTAVFIFEATGSAVQLGLIGAVQLVVQVPALLFGGTLADHADRKRLMAGTEAVSAALIAAAAVLAVAGRLAPWHVYLVIAVTSVSGVFGSPARSALTRTVVPRTHLMHAVTTNTVTQQAGAIIAPLLFAGVVSWLGLTAAFVVTTFVSLPSILLPLAIRVTGIPEGSTGRPQESTARQIWDGFQFVRKHPILPGLFVLDIGITVVSFYRQILPLLVDRLYHGGAAAVGVLTAANSLGAVGGSFVVLFLARVRPKGMIVLYATLAYAFLLFAFGFSTATWMGVVVIAGLGAADAVGMTMRQVTVQLTTPDRMLGRALSFQSLVAQSANNAGTIEVGVMSAAIGAKNTLLLGGVIGVAATLVIWRAMRGIREYRYP